MATVIDDGRGGFIAGDTPTELPAGHVWCPSCRGDGLEDDWDDDGPYLVICGECRGTGTLTRLLDSTNPDGHPCARSPILFPTVQNGGLSA